MKLRVVLVVTFLLSFIASSRTSEAVQPESQSQAGASASITGRVTLHGKPVPGVMMLVRSWPPTGADPQSTGKTDSNGQYQIRNLPSGRYSIVVRAPSLVEVEERDSNKTEITLDRGEIRENIDFALMRGGVITGRVSEANGRSIVEEPISVIALSPDGRQPYYSDSHLMSSDDRGVYRVYGLRPGRYKVSVGAGGGSLYRRLDHGQTYYLQTYYPGVTDESKARVVELTEGAEVSGVDIVVGGRERSFEASGRIVEAETGRPQAGINWGFGGNAMSTFGRKSDEEGRFTITGLMPGRYSVFAGCEGDYFSEKVDFEVTDHDVTGLEIRRNRGASISGKVVVEGVSEPAVLSKLTRVSLNAGTVGSRIDPDGTYYFCGLRPGMVKISAGTWQEPGFWLLRIERDGVDLRQGIEVTPGDHVTEVRIVLGYATGVIRGQVTVPGYDLPRGVRLTINARRLAQEDDDKHLSADTDELGRFTIEGLTSGEYELTAGRGYSSTSAVVRLPLMHSVTQKVRVTDGAESAVTLVLRLIEKPKSQ
ncbi:MAG: carboxypeptidase-like regulatory domain-containing protein [Blastocatellia bacterium]